MDEYQYKSVRDKLTIVPCAFEKSILSLKVRCSKATKKNIAEREVVMCTEAYCAERCKNWLTLLRKKSQFSLHTSVEVSVLPHSKEMKVQVGGILGLCKALDWVFSESVLSPDVFDVLELYDARIEAGEELPFGEIIQGVQHFRLR